ncbi:Bifunctional NMN adenylyltransferase/Nudix hydrolase [Methyloligella halotolerans]|uniref:Bifunctional NMN adenylyltransferase/Nudix hydrolase n=1 Tax=Methyloligella halotolerans TaxID=1177755 RepID=A0A1E2RZ87_9HYPH|nr:NUDIX hydrolase [Methyloligella halotolerans]ODA67470.1 Bifunctional NMN adenylyltransferase/Nudix hydrolase [Methyloligella halotolerans]
MATPMGMPETPALTTDCVILDAAGRVLLIRRKNPPYKGEYALPGGFVDIGETVEDGCRREVKEEVGLDVGPLRLIGVFSDPSRDPRGHTVSAAFLAELTDDAVPVAGDDAASAEWIEDWQSVDLAFDHAQIMKQAMRLAAQSERS